MRPAQGTPFDRRERIDGEVFGETPGPIVFLSSTRTQGYPRLGRWLTGASSPVTMADGGGHAVARRLSPAMVGSSEDDPTSMVT